MKLFTALVALCTLSDAALAQAPDCRSIVNADARLACYDKAAPPVTASARTAPRAVPASKVEATGYVDSLSAEDARVNAQMKNICRGC